MIPFIRDRAFSMAALVLAAVVGARAFHPFTALAPHIDSGVYMLAGTHILHGKLLYREVWDHKPPLVHLVNAFALAAGDGTVNAVRSVERVLAALVAVTFFLTLRAAFADLAIAVFGTTLLLMHFYSSSVFRGNQPEEYGAILALLGVACSVVAARQPGRYGMVFPAVSGLAFGLASLAKETFALGAVPFFAWLVLLVWSDRQEATRRGASFLTGAALPWLLFYAWLTAEGLWPEWRQILAFNLSYVRFDAKGAPNPEFLAGLWLGAQRAWTLLLSVSWTALALGILGAASIFDRRFQRTTAYLPVASLGFFLASLVATSQGRRYDYYFLQLVGSFILLSASGLSFAVYGGHLCEKRTRPAPTRDQYAGAGDPAGRKRRGLRVAILLSAVASMLVLDGKLVMTFAKRVAQPYCRFGDGDQTVAFIRANTSAEQTVWNLVRESAWICAHADRLSPTRYFFISARLFRDLPDPKGARREIHDALSLHPPQLVLFDGHEAWLETAGVKEWFHGGNEPTQVPRVYRRRQSTISVSTLK